MKKRISVCLVLLLGWLASYAQEPADSLAQPAAEQSESAPRPTTDELWDMANTAYINGNFHSAAEVYEEILSRGVSSVKLYYNLANAYFKEDASARPSSITNGRCGWLPATTTSATT